MKRPDIGATFTNGIDNITDDGTGQITVHDGVITVGPVTEDALGVKVEATLVEHDRAELHTEAVQPPVDELGSLKDSFTIEETPRVGKTFSAVIDEVTDNAHGLIYTRTGYIDLGPVTEDAEGEYVHALKLPGNAARVKSAKVQPRNYIDKLEDAFNFGFSLEFGEASAELHKRDHTGGWVIGSYASIDEVRTETNTESGVDVSELESGDVFSAEVQRISGSGNGIIETVSGTEMNIGQAPKNAVGETVTVYYNGNPHYGEYLPSKEPVFTSEIDQLSGSGNGILSPDGWGLNIGPVKPEFVGESVKVREFKSAHGECLTIRARSEDYETEWILNSLLNGDLSPGVEFTVTIDRINENGEGIIHIGDKTINTGTVQETAVENKNGVRVKIFNSEFAKCVDIEIRDTPYRFPDGVTAEYLPSTGGVFHDVIDAISEEGHGLILTGTDQYVNIGPVKPGSTGQRVHIELLGPGTGKCLTEAVRGDTYDEWLETTDRSQRAASETPDVDAPAAKDTDRGTQHGEHTEPTPGADSESESSESPAVGESPEPDPVPTENTPGEEEPRTPQVEVSEPAVSDREANRDIDELREKAVEDSVENVPASTTTTTTRETSKQEYTRSPAIREYVKARADGYCEACGDPAPFKNTDGDPYLHAHHIHELSDGGSDTVDTVAAICPNCHYRIHHGNDGDAYNQSLREKIRAIENDQ